MGGCVCLLAPACHAVALAAALACAHSTYVVGYPEVGVPPSSIAYWLAADRCVRRYGLLPSEVLRPALSRTIVCKPSNPLLGSLPMDTLCTLLVMAPGLCSMCAQPAGWIPWLDCAGYVLVVKRSWTCCVHVPLYLMCYAGSLGFLEAVHDGRLTYLNLASTIKL